MEEDVLALPRGWAAARLGQIILKPRPKIQADPRSRLPFIGMDHIESDSFHLVGQDEFAKMKSAGSYFKPGDVLYGRLRPYLNKVHRAKFEGVASAEFIVLPSSEFFDSEFLKYVLHQRKFIDFAMSRASGDRPRVKFDGIAEFEFPLPPLNEQRRIVEKIETLFARLDQGEAALRQVQKLLARYRQSVLKAAVTGELTRDWRAENAHRLEHGRDLLARILQTRRETWQGHGPYKEPAAPDTTGLPELPQGWVWSSFEQLFEAKSDGGKKLPQKQYLDSGLFPVIDQGEAGIGGYANDETLAYDGVLPVIIFGDHTRRFKLVRDRFVCGADGVKIIEPSRSLPVEYLFILLASAKFEDRGYSRHFQFVRRLVFPLASEAEAREIVRRYEVANALITELENCCGTELARSAALRQSILKDAFAGKLVPQDPADEPAAELLARIRASRAAQPQNTRRSSA